MSEVVIYENPGNKAARLERENNQLRAENHRLREALGGAEIVASAVVSQAPALPQAQTFSHGACSVTIGGRPGGAHRPTAIPSLEQASQAGQDDSQAQDGATTVAIFNANAPPVAQPARAAVPPRKIGIPGGQPGGGMTFDLSMMRPTPPPAQRPPAAPAPVAPVALDDARQRFALLELDGLEGVEQKTGTGKAG